MFCFNLTQWSKECWCGDNYDHTMQGPQVPDSECDMPCEGNPSQTCGGWLRIQIYTGI